jgi:hypothetical protein
MNVVSESDCERGPCFFGCLRSRCSAVDFCRTLRLHVGGLDDASDPLDEEKIRKDQAHQRVVILSFCWSAHILQFWLLDERAVCLKLIDLRLCQAEILAQNFPIMLSEHRKNRF